MSEEFDKMMKELFGSDEIPVGPTPKRKPKEPTGLQTSSKPMTLQVAWDGTNTTVEAMSIDEYGGPVIIARGTARRRKGDPRNEQVGFALATARVFRALAEREESFVRRIQGDE